MCTSLTGLSSVGKENSGDGQRKAEVYGPPRVGLGVGLSTAVVLTTSRASTVDRIAGRVVKLALLGDTALTGRHVGRHVAYLVRVRYIHTRTHM